MQISNKEKLNAGINIPSYGIIKQLSPSHPTKAWKLHLALPLTTQHSIDPPVKYKRLENVCPGLTQGCMGAGPKESKAQAVWKAALD